MGHIVRMPKLDPKTAPETLRSWAVDAGDSVGRGDAIARVGSGSNDAAIEAREDGVLRRAYAEEGTVVPPGTPIGIVGSADADVADLDAEAATELAKTVAESIGSSGTAIDAADATAAEMPGRTVTAHNPDGVAGTIEAGSFERRFDEPESAGGSETGPTPVDVFLGGFAACLSLSLRFQAEKRETPVGGIHVTADAEPDRGPVERLAVIVRLETDADDETIDRIVAVGERGCHVSQMLRDDLPLEVEWERA